MHLPAACILDLVLYPFEFRDETRSIIMRKAAAQSVVFRKQSDHDTEPARNNIKHSTRQVVRDFLRKSGKPHPLCTNNLTCVWEQLAADDFQKSRLAGTVSPYQADSFSTLDLQGHPINELWAAECNLHFLQAD
jgi:hypothetical protein